MPRGESDFTYCDDKVTRTEAKAWIHRLVVKFPEPYRATFDPMSR